MFNGCQQNSFLFVSLYLKLNHSFYISSYENLRLQKFEVKIFVLRDKGLLPMMNNKKALGLLISCTPYISRNGLHQISLFPK